MMAGGYLRLEKVARALALACVEAEIDGPSASRVGDGAPPAG